MYWSRQYLSTYLKKIATPITLKYVYRRYVAHFNLALLLASWTLMHYGQYKQVALRHQAMLVTRGAHHRFGRVNKIADKEKENVTLDN